jgi:hypothetical protein
VFKLFGGLDTFAIENIVFNILVATLIGLFIYFVYKKTYTGVMYSQNFNVTILLVCVITSIIMMLIGNNMALSLGLVGSLSIIRFRTAIKEPRDIAFIFWAISVGLAAGTSEFIIAITGSIIIAFLLFIFNRVIYRDYCYLLILKGVEIQSKTVIDIFGEYEIPHKLRMKNVNNAYTEVTYEITLKSVGEDVLIKALKAAGGADEVHIVSYNGEITG